MLELSGNTYSLDAFSAVTARCIHGVKSQSLDQSPSAPETALLSELNRTHVAADRCLSCRNVQRV